MINCPKRRLGKRQRAVCFGAGALAISGLCGVVLGAEAPLLATVGKALVERVWVPAPSSTRANDGLGPLFNARACATCHAAAGAGRIETDPKGHLADRGAVVRLATPHGDPDPVYGRQIQTRSVQNVPSEAIVTLDWVDKTVTLADGSRAGLRAPRLELSSPGYGELAKGTVASLLLAPSLHIAGRIAMVDREALRREAGVAPAPAAPASRGVASPGITSAGMFGRKASEATLHDAITMAFHRDLGMSSARHPAPEGDCTASQTACRSSPHGSEGATPEIAPDIVAAIASYIETLAPPVPPQAAYEAGAQVFSDTGCASCHRPDLPARAGARVALYSDLALHRMGPALSGASEDAAVPADAWRTAALIGIAQRLASGSTLLHDGRARSVEEAILWHDGEARDSRERYARLSKEGRETLVRYVMNR